MGVFESSNSRDYKQQLGYYPDFDERPVGDQDFIIIEARHLSEIINGQFSDLFEDEVVECVWIYHCPLQNTEVAKICATVFSAIALVAAGLSFVPAIYIGTISVAAVAIIGAIITGVVVLQLNHQFVMIETRNWLYVVAKHKGGCECFRGRHQLRNNLIDTQRQYLRKRRLLQPDPTPKVWKCDTGDSRLFDMLMWMKNEKVIETNYNWAGENCKHLAKPLFNFLAKSKRC